MRKKINVTLSGKEVEYIEWFGKKNGYSFQEAMQVLFYRKISEDRELYEAEINEEEN